MEKYAEKMFDEVAALSIMQSQYWRRARWLGTESTVSSASTSCHGQWKRPFSFQWKSLHWRSRVKAAWPQKALDNT
jgi:hypothetical protein